MPDIRRFNEIGLSRFSAYLDLLGIDPRAVLPADLLVDSSSSEFVAKSKVLAPRQFSTKFDVAENVDAVFRDAAIVPAFTDTGVWAWLACFFFDSLCPADPSGRRQAKGKERWIPEQNWQGYYRHFIAGPFGIYMAHRDHLNDAAILLQSPATSLSDYMEQLASRQELVTSRAVLGAASALYFDPHARQPKRGGQTRKKPGTLRRYLTVLEQLDLTFDIESLTVPQLLALLPQEFDRWKAS
jgi:hypothetical protein